MERGDEKNGERGESEKMRGRMERRRIEAKREARGEEECRGERRGGEEKRGGEEEERRRKERRRGERKGERRGQKRERGARKERISTEQNVPLTIIVHNGATEFISFQHGELLECSSL